MLADVAQRPPRLTMCKWDGTNTEQVVAYVANLKGTYGSAEFVADSSAAGRIVFTTWQEVPDKIVKAGDWLHGMSDHYGPFVNVYTADELNARYYPYPDYAPVDSSGMTA